jgi:hypothetical protein
LITPDASIEAALKAVKLFQGIRDGGCDLGGRFIVQSICLN